MSHEPLPDRWTTRDLPVLRAAAPILDEGGIVDSEDAEFLEEVGMPQEVVAQALVALGQAEYLDVGVTQFLSGDVSAVASGLLERGRRAVGIWPDGEAAVEQLLSALRQAEELTADVDDKTALRKASGQLASVSRSVVAEVIAAVVTRQAGIG